MIVFAPGYDEATRANLAVARALKTPPARALLGEEATRAALLQALADAETPLFSMSHGRPDYLRAQHGLIALAIDDVGRLGRRAVFSFACHTATRLGERARDSGATWWGYTGKIQSPDDNAPFLSIFIDIFSWIQLWFAAANTASERALLVEEIAGRCEAGLDLVDSYAAADPDLNTAPATLCLLHIWDRLRIWAPDIESPERHPRACPPSLFLED